MPRRVIGAMWLSLVLALAATAQAQGATWIELGSPWGAIADVHASGDAAFGACDAGLLRLEAGQWTLVPHGGAFAAAPVSVLALSPTRALVGVGPALVAWDAASGFAELARVQSGTIAELASPDGRRVFAIVLADGMGALHELRGTTLSRVPRLAVDVRAIDVLSPREAIAVGYGVARWDGRAWRASGSADATMRAVAFEGPRRAWAVAPETATTVGGLWAWDGRAVAPVEVPDDVRYALAIEVVAPGELLIATGAALMRGSGTAWRTIGPGHGVRGLARVGERVLAYGASGLLGPVGDAGVEPVAPVGLLGPISAVGGESASAR